MPAAEKILQLGANEKNQTLKIQIWAGEWELIFQGSIQNMYEGFGKEFEKCGSTSDGQHKASPKCLSRPLFGGASNDRNLNLCLKLNDAKSGYCTLLENTDGTLRIDPETPDQLFGKFPHAAPKSALKRISQIPYEVVAAFNNEKQKKNTSVATNEQKWKAFDSAGCKIYTYYKILQRIDNNNYRIGLSSGSTVECTQYTTDGQCKSQQGESQYGTLPGTIVLLKTTTLRFNSDGVKNDKLYVKKGGKQQVRGTDGFDHSVDTLVQSDECERLAP